MKKPVHLLLLQFLLLQLSLSAQIQWYQNQDGNNQPPNGTSPTSVLPFSSNTFMACYLWNTQGDTYTWKISKTNFSGAELKTFFVSGITSQVEIRVGHFSTVYVLQRNYPIGGNPEYIVYKLDANLVVKAQKTLSFPGDYNVFNLNCFELDKSDNVYLAGDGQYPMAGGFDPASFVMKTNKNLQTQWTRMDSTQTSYTRLHTDRWGRVIVIEDFYTFFPEIRIKKINPNGQYAQSNTIATSEGRYSLFSSLDQDDNILLYGGKTIGDTAQGMFLYKISRSNGAVLYQKTHFKAPGSQLNDLKVDRQGKIFVLTTLYPGPGDQACLISRINSRTGNISWNYTMPYENDSCVLTRLVVNDNERFYAVGQRNSNNYFSKGFAMRMKKTGQAEGSLPGPDSVSYQRLHWLCDGLTDNNNRLIAVGGTSDFDTTLYMNTYLRAFAVRFGNNVCNPANKSVDDTEMITASEKEPENEKLTAETKLVVYPNPVQDQLTVSNLKTDDFDRITVYNMQGAVVLQRTAKENAARLDVSSLPDGVYLLVLRSTVTFKEKSMKIVVRK